MLVPTRYTAPPSPLPLPGRISTALVEISPAHVPLASLAHHFLAGQLRRGLTTLRTLQSACRIVWVLQNQYLNGMNAGQLKKESRREKEVILLDSLVYESNSV